MPTGPIGLIVAPTRELVQQIHAEAERFAKAYDMQVIAIHGGESKWQQQQALAVGAELVAGTPVRGCRAVACRDVQRDRARMCGARAACWI